MSPGPVIPAPKRGILDEGVYLTDVGQALIKKIRIKPPAPARRQRAPKNTLASSSLPLDSMSHSMSLKREKQDDEMSQASSNEDKNEHLMADSMDVKESPCNSADNSFQNGSKNAAKKIIQQQQQQQIKGSKKQQQKIGIGGFNIKTGRSKNTKQQQHNDDEPLDNSIEASDADSKHINAKTQNRSRKKKQTMDDVFPAYMRVSLFIYFKLFSIKIKNNFKFVCCLIC